MLIMNPPGAIVDNFLMLGTNQYPLFLFQGEKEGALFEGGTGAMGPLVLEQLEQRGIGKDFIRQAVITHAHPDHVMAIPLFRQEFSRLRVLSSRKTQEALTAAKALSFFCEVDRKLTERLLKEGLITEKHRASFSIGEGITIDRSIKDGDLITVGRTGSFRVMETPGHTEDSLSFYEADHKIMIVSDATGYYLPQQNYWWPNYFQDYGAYVKSMQRMAELDAEILCLSHNGVVKDAGAIQAYLCGAISATEDYHQRIVREVRAGKPVRQLAEELGREVYQRTQLLPVEFFQKNCGVLIKKSLEHEGTTVAEGDKS